MTDRLNGTPVPQLGEITEEEHEQFLAKIREHWKRLLTAALRDGWDDLMVIALDHPGTTIGGARGNDKHGAYLVISVPDEVVVNQRGNPEQRDCILLCHIPRSMQRILEGADAARVLKP